MLILPSPPQTLFTARLLIRPLELSDASDLWEAYSDTEAMRFRGSAPLGSLLEAEAMIQTALKKQAAGQSVRLAIVLPPENKTIGTFLYKTSVQGELEIGYSLNRQYWRKGYGGEVVGAMVHQLHQQGVKNLLASCHPENIGSISLLKKVGFVQIQAELLDGLVWLKKTSM